MFVSFSMKLFMPTFIEDFILKSVCPPLVCWVVPMVWNRCQRQEIMEGWTSKAYLEGLLPSVFQWLFQVQLCLVMASWSSECLNSQKAYGLWILLLMHAEQYSHPNFEWQHVHLLCTWEPGREAGDVWSLPPVWNLRAVIGLHFIISSLVLLPSPIILSVLSFFSACWSILLYFFRKFLQYSSLRDRPFCMAPV